MIVVIDQQAPRMADTKEEEVAIVGKEVRRLLVRLDATCNAIIDRDDDCHLECTLQLVDEHFQKNIQKRLNDIKANY